MNIRSLLWLGVTAAAVGLAGCGGEETTSSSSAPAAETSSTDTVSSVAQASSSSEATIEEPTTAEPTTPAPSVETQFLGGYSGHPTGEGDYYYESVEFNIPGFDREKSLAVFQETLYPHLKEAGCAGCHNSEGLGQAPYHSDANPEIAHEAALTKFNPYNPEQSRFVERLRLDRHNCPGSSCASAADEMQTAVEAWVDGISDMIPEVPRGPAEGATIAEADVEAWIETDKAAVAAGDQEYMVYTSLHELYNEGLSGYELNLVRVAISKALNTNARWAPALAHPVDVTGDGILYRFDIRDYWGYNMGIDQLYFGGSDDDLAFGSNKLDYKGNSVDGIQTQNYGFGDTITEDPAHAKLVWQRVLHGNVEGAVDSGTLPPYIDGFKASQMSSNAAGDYVEMADLKWVEASQLVYTLTRPDVYNSINAMPFYADEFERNIKIDNSEGSDSYDWILVKDAITVDSRLLFRAKADLVEDGWYYKSYDVFTGQLSSGGDKSIYDIYSDPTGQDIRFPWWANPVPKFVMWKSTEEDNTHFSHLAGLNQAYEGQELQNFINASTAGCDPQPGPFGQFKNCRHFTGKGGFMQQANESIFKLPNGLQGYWLSGGENQRRVDAFTNIVRDPRVIVDAGDDIGSATGYSYSCSGGTCSSGGFGRAGDPRLNIGHSCIGCHADGMNRMTNDLRIGMDERPGLLPKGEHGVDGWIDDQATVARVKELYPEDSWWQDTVESDREGYMHAIGEIKEAMMLGEDKNVYGEPIVWTAEYVQRVKYQYPQTRSN